MKTLFIGQNSIHVESLDSTNSYASEMLRQIALPEGSIIYSFKQSNGRGQRGNAWLSEPNKNIALSLILHPKFLPVEKQFLLTKITSLAVADLMSELLADSTESSQIKIKWPNDIYVNGKKIAGILIENILKETMVHTSIVGVGINVNQNDFMSLPSATSLSLLSGKEYDLMSLFDRFCEFFEVRYLQIKSNKLDMLNSSYIERLYKMGEWATYSSHQINFEGKIIGVSAVGKLQIELKTGVIREFDLKEIAFE